MSETCNDTCTVAHPACTHPLPNTTTHNHRFKPGGVSPVYYLSASGTIPHIPAERDSKITICNTNEAHTFKHVCADTLCIISHCTPYTIKPVCYIVHIHRYTIYFTHHSGDFPELCSLLPLYIHVQTVQKCHPFNSCLYTRSGVHTVTQCRLPL